MVLKNHGWSLIELIITLFVSSIVVALGFSLLQKAGKGVFLGLGKQKDFLVEEVWLEQISHNVMMGQLVKVGETEFTVLSSNGIQQFYHLQDSTLYVNESNTKLSMKEFKVLAFGPNLRVGDEFSTRILFDAKLDSLDKNDDGILENHELDEDKDGVLMGKEIQKIGLLELSFETGRAGHEQKHVISLHPRSRCDTCASNSKENLLF